MKKILICLSIILAGGVALLAGCNPSDNNLTLAQAKEIIVNALSMDSTVETTSVKSFSTDNRNIFVKLNRASVEIDGLTDLGTKITGEVERGTNGWTGYSLSSLEEYFEYYVNDTAYFKHDNETATNPFDSSRFGIYLQSFDVIYVDLLFLDDAFDSIYENSVTKTSQGDTYTMTMNIKMPNYVDYVMQKANEIGFTETEGLFGEGEDLERNKNEGSAELVVTFSNNDEILGLDLSVKALGTDRTTFSTTRILVEKFDGEITAPAWFDINDFNI